MNNTDTFIAPITGTYLFKEGKVMLKSIVIESKKIVDIKEALQGIRINADMVISPAMSPEHIFGCEVDPKRNCQAIIREVEIIDKLLPDVKSEEQK